MTEIKITMKIGAQPIGVITKQLDGTDSEVLQEVVETIGRNCANNPQHKLMTEEIDLRTEPVAGAPVSLRKFLESGHAKTEFTLIVGRIPIVADDPDTLNVLAPDRDFQAEYFLGLNLPMPNYLRKYLAMMYPDEDLDARYRFARTDKGMRQMIGLIQLVAGGLNMARKQGKCLRLYIEEPETHLHPAEQRHVIDMLKALKEEYGFKEPQAQATT